MRLLILFTMLTLCYSPNLLAQSTALWETILEREFDVMAKDVQADVVWRDDLKAAFALAQQQEAPLLVTLRCLPCKQCAEFDKNVLEAGPELEKRLKKFVTVRLTSADVDLNIFPIEKYQDLDLSWWAYLLSPKGEIYAVFGGKDHISDTTRISVPALINTMERVLDHHYDPQRKTWQVDGDAPNLKAAAYKTSDLPGFEIWKNNRQHELDSCIHCHQAAEIVRQESITKGTFDKQKDTQIWPFPENVGILLDRDHGLKVLKVEPNSAADNTGIKPGDILGVAEGRRLFGQADFRGVLHRGPQAAGEIAVSWTRSGKAMHGTLKVQEGWRVTDLGWRQSISQGNIGKGPGFFPLKVNPGLRKSLNITADEMAIEPFMGKFHHNLPAYKAGLRRGDVVVAVNGENPNLVGRPFLVWYRLKYDVGDKVTFTVKNRQGKTRDISITVQ